MKYSLNTLLSGLVVTGKPEIDMIDTEVSDLCLVCPYFCRHNGATKVGFDECYIFALSNQSTTSPD